MCSSCVTKYQLFSVSDGRSLQACPQDVVVEGVVEGDAAVATVSFSSPADVEYVHKWIVHGNWDGAVDVVSHCDAGIAMT